MSFCVTFGFCFELIKQAAPALLLTGRRDGELFAIASHPAAPDRIMHSISMPSQRDHRKLLERTMQQVHKILRA